MIREILIWNFVGGGGGGGRVFFFFFFWWGAVGVEEGISDLIHMITLHLDILKLFRKKREKEDDKRGKGLLFFPLLHLA